MSSIINLVSDDDKSPKKCVEKQMISLQAQVASMQRQINTHTQMITSLETTLRSLKNSPKRDVFQTPKDQIVKNPYDPPAIVRMRDLEESFLKPVCTSFPCTCAPIDKLKCPFSTSEDKKLVYPKFLPPPPPLPLPEVASPKRGVRMSEAQATAHQLRIIPSHSQEMYGSPRRDPSSFRIFSPHSGSKRAIEEWDREDIPNPHAVFKK
jgi:hypothetical protein